MVHTVLTWKMPGRRKLKAGVAASDLLIDGLIVVRGDSAQMVLA